MSDWQAVYKDIEDRLAPQLKFDVWERVVYYHLLRHTRLEGQDTRLFSIDPLSASLRLSNTKVREFLPSLDRKGCTKNEVTRLGYKIRVLLPAELSLVELSGAPSAEPVDIETLDFFEGRKYLGPLLERESQACFYCLTKLQATDSELDHVVPGARTFDNSYRNIVVCCHPCNRKKGEQEATDFIRTLFRQGLLSELELQERIVAVESVRAGLLRPILR